MWLIPFALSVAAAIVFSLAAITLRQTLRLTIGTLEATAGRASLTCCCIAA